MEIKTVSVNCPTCGKEVLMIKSSEFRPFCSKRCRDLDFGDWANESFRIGGDSVESDTWSDDISDPK